MSIYTLIHVWEEERCIRGFGGKLAGQTALGRPRRRMEDNIEIDLQDVELGRGGGCTGLIQVRLRTSRGFL
jgi:hypothetical protein